MISYQCSSPSLVIGYRWNSNRSNNLHNRIHANKNNLLAGKHVMLGLKSSLLHIY